MIVDFHTHLLPASFQERHADLVARDNTFGTLFAAGGAMVTADELVAAMDESGVDLSVVLGFGWCDREIAREANDCLLDAAARYPQRIVAFCSVHPGWGDDALREVERCVDAGAVGIGELHPALQGLDLATDDSMEPLARFAAERGLLVNVHGSEPVGHVYPGKGPTTPERLLAIAERFPDVRWIFPHWGGGLPFYALMPEVRAALANTWFDSAVSPFLYDAEVFDVASRAVGADHVLFGSDYPLLPASRVADQARSTLDAAVAQAVLGGNAARLLGLADD
ncbi:MAG: amidohydrolase family protein [Chloroflexota bacterium]|nr:amidohydrolase family protein [Chloroflexota bacterium]MDE2885883.1 amidohydrolase family protein [Chloroflexota bacterium]